MNWVKKGRIFKVKGDRKWALTHAQVPIVEPVNSDVLRIYYGTRDDKNRTRTSFIEVNAHNPSEILYKHPIPILKLGPAGTFDDSGVMPSEVVRYKGRTYFYYVGWNTGNTARYRTALGLAISDDGRTFKKVFPGPVMDRNINDPVSVSCQAMINENGKLRTWYMSYLGWENINGLMEPSYEIKYAESADGINWRRDGIVAVALAQDEGGIACPTVIKHEGVYKMWYSVRGKEEYRTEKNNSYRIGYAESADGIRFERQDQFVGINPSKNGWDSAMIAYPSVFKTDDKLYMFYNGNGFGASGFGYAEFTL